MVSIGSRRMLGLVVGQKAILIAELAPGKPSRVVRQDRFEWPAELSLDKPAELGKLLEDFLRRNRYTARHVVVGLPSRWTLAKARSLPPANASAIPALLRLAVEREYHANAKEWAFDYLTLPAGQDQSTHVLLGAAPRQRLDQIEKLLQAAKLTPVAMVPSSLTAVTQMAAKSINDSAAILMTGEEGSELVVRSAGRWVSVERLVAGVHQPEAMAMEIRRALAMHQISDENLLIHDSRPSPDDAAKWQSILKLPVTLLPLWGGTGSQAGLIASAWSSDKAAVLDFQHSRLSETTNRRFTRLHMLGALAILAVVVLVGYSTIDWYIRWNEVQSMKAELASMQNRLTTARENVDRLRLARGWYDARPRMLDAMRAITLTFPTNGQVWGTNLTVRDDMTITLTGKAQDERAVVDLMERMRSLPAFSEIKLQELRATDRNSRNVNFSMLFLYTGKD